MTLALAMAVLAAAGLGPATRPPPLPPGDLTKAPAQLPANQPRMGQEALSRSLPAYPGATDEPVPVGETIEAKGVPMNVQSFMTNDPPRKVLDFYEGFFKDKGLHLLGNGDMVVKFAYPSVTAMDETNDIDISVITVPSPDKRTMVLLARADMRPLLANLGRNAASRYGGLPQYPNGESPSAVNFTDGEVHTTQVTFETRDPTAQVLAFYKKTFGDRGIGLARDEPGTSTFKAADGLWRVSASVDPTTGKTLVTAMHAPAELETQEPR